LSDFYDLEQERILWSVFLLRYIAYHVILLHRVQTESERPRWRWKRRIYETYSASWTTLESCRPRWSVPDDAWPCCCRCPSMSATSAANSSNHTPTTHVAFTDLITTTTYIEQQPTLWVIKRDSPHLTVIWSNLKRFL